MIKHLILSLTLCLSVPIVSAAEQNIFGGYTDGFKRGWNQRFQQVGKTAPNVPPHRNPSPRANGDTSTDYTKGYIDGLLEADRRLGAPIKERN
jgi:hypothetical protein